MGKLNVIDVLDDVLKYADDIFETVPKSMERNNVYILALLFSLYDTVNDINHLTKAKRLLNIPSLVRNFMDSYIDLLLIQKDNDLIFHLLLNNSKNKLKAIQGKLKVENKLVFNYDSQQIKDLEKQKREIESDNTELNKKIKRPLIKQISTKYEEVGMLWFYETIYNDLCSHTHNSLDMIEFRHIDQVNHDKVILKYCQEYDYKKYEWCYLLLLNYFHDSLVVGNQLLGLKKDIMISAIENRISEYNK